MYVRETLFELRNQFGSSFRCFVKPPNCRYLVALIAILVLTLSSRLEVTCAEITAGATINSDSAARRSAYRIFAETHEGDVARGKEVFQNEKKVACQKCHTIDATRKSVGPDLKTIGDKYERRDLIASVLEPSKGIAVGYGVTIVATTSGFVHHGILQRVTNSSLELKNKDNQTIQIRNDDIDEQSTSEVSLMPEGLEAQISTQEFTDLIAFLESQKQSKSSTSGSNEVIEEIVRCVTPVSLIPFLPNSVKLDKPVWFGQIPGEPRRFVILEHFGKIWTVNKDAENAQQHLFLDLSKTIRGGGATGLLGMAFHPKFADNRRYFLKYQINETGRITTIVEEREWKAENSAESAVNPPRQILKIVGTTQDHNGGCLTFGPDGFLYVGMGDSGPQEDPQGHGQDLQTMLGKILRIDVDRVDKGLAYAIPRDNPFLGNLKALPEIWAYGFREPWRFSFDSLTGDLWVGDVGQNRFEEVAIVRSGENHGWNVMEGFADHSRQFRSADGKYVSPVFAYPRRFGVSVTGGYVYRGQRAPHLRGSYIFGDFESRRIWALKQKDRQFQEIVEIGRAPSRIVSFAEGIDGELYLVGYDSGTIFHIDFEKVDLSPRKVRIIAETAESAPVLWQYRTEPPPSEWQSKEFDDSSWKTGPSGFGTMGTPGGIIRTDWDSQNIWIRRKFEVSHIPESHHAMALRIHHDEDAVIYINGIEAARLNGWTTGYQEVPVSQIAAQSLRIGKNVLAIHCRQTGGGQFIDAGLVEFITPKQ